jgi:hypothetical protein
MYEMSYPGRVLDAVRELIARNPTRPAAVRAAVRKIDRVLRVYPQFGQPLSDLSIPGAQRWVAVVSPFVVQYAVVEADDTGRRQQVLVSRPFALLPNSGLV